MPNHEVPDDAAAPTAIAVSAEQAALVERIARSHAAAAPAGWLRIVCREECSVDPEIDGIASVQEVVVETTNGLEQQPFTPSRELHFESGDMLRELADSSPTQTVVMLLVVDRDGTHEATFTSDVPRVLVGIRDETSSKPVHEYLERNRAELTALLG